MFFHSQEFNTRVAAGSAVALFLRVVPTQIAPPSTGLTVCVGAAAPLLEFLFIAIHCRFAPDSQALTSQSMVPLAGKCL